MTAFGAIDFANDSFNDAVKTPDTSFIYFYRKWAKSSEETIFMNEKFQIIIRLWVIKLNEAVNMQIKRNTED